MREKLKPQVGDAVRIKHNYGFDSGVVVSSSSILFAKVQTCDGVSDFVWSVVTLVSRGAKFYNCRYDEW